MDFFSVAIKSDLEEVSQDLFIVLSSQLSLLALPNLVTWDKDSNTWLHDHEGV